MASPYPPPLSEQKAKLLDGAPLCAVILDANGKASASNKLFDELMGPLFKFANYEFFQAAADDEGKVRPRESNPLSWSIVLSAHPWQSGAEAAAAAARKGGPRERIFFPAESR